MTKIQKFLEYCKPDENGFTKIIYLEELNQKYPGEFLMGNGGSWCRNDGALKEYNIERIKEKKKIIAIKLNGYNDNIRNNQIPKKIYNFYKNCKCVFFGRENIEIDHKYGDKTLYNNIEFRNDPKNYQPLCKSANDLKRQICKECDNTKEKFDAKIFGYPLSTIESTENKYFCDGCFWCDIQKFKNFFVITKKES